MLDRACRGQHEYGDPRRGREHRSDDEARPPLRQQHEGQGASGDETWPGAGVDDGLRPVPVRCAGHCGRRGRPGPGEASPAPAEATMAVGTKDGRAGRECHAGGSRADPVTQCGQHQQARLSVSEQPDQCAERVGDRGAGGDVADRRRAEAQGTPGCRRGRARRPDGPSRRCPAIRLVPATTRPSSRVVPNDNARFICSLDYARGHPSAHRGEAPGRSRRAPLRPAGSSPLRSTRSWSGRASLPPPSTAPMAARRDWSPRLSNGGSATGSPSGTRPWRKPPTTESRLLAVFDALDSFRAGPRRRAVVRVPRDGRRVRRSRRPSWPQRSNATPTTCARD